MTQSLLLGPCFRPVACLQNPVPGGAPQLVLLLGRTDCWDTEVALEPAHLPYGSGYCANTVIFHSEMSGKKWDTDSILPSMPQMCLRVFLLLTSSIFLSPWRGTEIKEISKFGTFRGLIYKAGIRRWNGFQGFVPIVKRCQKMSF